MHVRTCEHSLTCGKHSVKVRVSVYLAGWNVISVMRGTGVIGSQKRGDASSWAEVRKEEVAFEIDLKE